MYPRRRMPIARTALLVGATSHIARGQVNQANMQAENAYYRDQMRQQEISQQMQMQAQIQAQQQAQQAAATEEAVRRGIAQAEEERKRAEQQNTQFQAQNYGQNSNVQQAAPVMTCDQCKAANQVTSSFCSNCGNRLIR